MTLSWQWDPARFASAVGLMAQLKAVPVEKVLRNAARDFSHGAYRATRSAAVARTNFLRVPDRRRGGTRWIRKTRVRRPGLRGGRTPNPPYPVAKGFARASWIGVFRDLGMTSARPAARVPASAVEIGSAEQRPDRLEIRDRLSYIGTLDARDGIVAVGLQRAEETMVRELDREARRMEALFA